MSPLVWLHSRELIEHVVYLQAQAIFALLLYTLFRMAIRTHFAHKNQKLRDFYSAQIIEEVINKDLGAKLAGPKGLNGFQRRVLKDVVLDTLDIVSGLERDHLVQAYVQMGYLEVDLRATRSWLWWKRLDAVSNLSKLKLSRLAEEMNRLRKDSNHFVMMAALLALSEINHPLNSPEIFRDLSPRALERSNLLLEIATNIGRIHGFEVLIQFLDPVYPNALRDACVRSIAASGDSQTSMLMAEMLTKMQWTAGVIAILGYLRKVGDPNHRLSVSPFLKHHDARVRSEAQNWFSQMNLDSSAEAA